MLNKDRIPDEQNDLKALEDRGWAEMAQMLNIHMPIQKKRRGLVAWWWLAAAALIGYGLFNIPFSTGQPPEVVMPAIASQAGAQEGNRKTNALTLEETTPQHQFAENSLVTEDKDAKVPSFIDNSNPSKSKNTFSAKTLNQPVSKPVNSATNTTHPATYPDADNLVQKTLLPFYRADVPAIAHSNSTHFEPQSFIERVNFKVENLSIGPKITNSQPITSKTLTRVNTTPWTLAMQSTAGTGFSQKIGQDDILKSGLHTIGIGIQLGYALYPKLEVAAGVGFQRWNYNQVLFRPSSNPQLLFGVDNYQEFFNANRTSSTGQKSTGSQLNYLTVPISISYKLKSNLWIETGVQTAVDLDIPLGTSDAVSVNQAGDPILDKSNGSITNTVNTVTSSVSLPLYRKVHAGYHLGLGWRVNSLEFGLRWYTSSAYLSPDLRNSRDYKHESLALTIKYRFPLFWRH